MIPLFNKPIIAKPDVNYLNFSKPYNNNLDAIILTADPLYLKNNHLFIQLIRQCSRAEDLEYYYRGSVSAISEFLTLHRYTSFNTLGRLHDPVFFAKPIKEVVLHHDEFPGTHLFLDKSNDPLAYEPVRLIYHPFTTLHFRYLDGNSNPIGEINDPYVYYVINVPELVLQWRSYKLLSRTLDAEPNIMEYVSQYIVIPLMKQYANISLYNRYMYYQFGKELNEDIKDHRFGFSTYNNNLLQKGIERNHRTSNKFGLDRILSLVPSLSDKVDFYTTHTTTSTMNARPFMDLARLNILIDLMLLLDEDEEKHTKARLRVYIKRMLKGREYMLFTGKDYPYFEGKLIELSDLLF